MGTTLSWDATPYSQQIADKLLYKCYAYIRNHRPLHSTNNHVYCHVCDSLRTVMLVYVPALLHNPPTYAVAKYRNLLEVTTKLMILWC
jgi:hypothetical protein